MRKSGAASGLCATRKTQRANEAAAALGAARRRSILVSFSLPLVPSPLSLFLSHTVCADEKVRCCISAREACFLLKEREDEGKEKRQVASVFFRSSIERRNSIIWFSRSFRRRRKLALS
jgi:hypothetical protein